MKCGALYVKDNLSLLFVVFDFYFVLGFFYLRLSPNMNENPIPKSLEGKYGYRF